MSASLNRLDSQRILALYEQGYSQRWIARRLDIAPRTVFCRLQDLLGQAPTDFVEIDPTVTEETPPGFDPANLRRCRGCGAIVYLWPCLACCLSVETESETIH